MSEPFQLGFNNGFHKKKKKNLHNSIYSEVNHMMINYLVGLLNKLGRYNKRKCIDEI